ncbi:MAG TPA: SpoIIE family protein phosphatase [Conexibacter sp.]|nr:SpoIIE family protein phosphatase [Conexibacter sp.]
MAATFDSNLQLQRRLAAIVETAHDAIYSYGADGRVNTWNPAAERIFGYAADEVIGRAPSFMLSPEREREERGLIARAIADERLHDVETQRIRADGAVIDVALTVSPLVDPDAGLVGVSLIARDITLRKRQADAQAFLAQASSALETSLDPDRTLQTVADLAVPLLAELCIIDLPRADGRLGDSVAAATIPGAAERLCELRRRWPLAPDGAHPVARALRSGRALVVPDLDRPGGLDDVAQSDEHRAFMVEAGYRCAVVLPLVAHRRTLGVLSLLHVRSDLRFDDADVALLEDLAARAAQAYDNARLYAERAHVARTLQRSLLPRELPQPPGLELAARYRSATTDLEVGGDFYDVFEADGGWLAILGDVCGKGPQAAALTALARYTARAAALHTSEPGEILAQLNEAMLRSATDHRFATAFLARVETGAAGGGSGARVTCATAGHPEGLLLRAGGAVETVGGPGHPLGIRPAPRFHRAQAELRPGDTLLLYTDGLVDLAPPGRALDTGDLAELLAGLARLAPDDLLDELEQRVDARRDGARQRDDVALLALRVV